MASLFSMNLLSFYAILIKDARVYFSRILPLQLWECNAVSVCLVWSDLINLVSHREVSITLFSQTMEKERMEKGRMRNDG
ncbi:MAG: hypothetical protein GKR95_01135 [Gammaproteobacteria bacterium]|nr:hypothetical protein [Gammaproteobacteria bacterium]